MAIAVFALFWVLAVWVLPVWVGYRIGARKGRAGWAWGFFLGWLGVLIVALLSNRNVEHYYDLTPKQVQQRQLADLEAYVRSEERYRRRHELQS